METEVERPQVKCPRCGYVGQLDRKSNRHWLKCMKCHGFVFWRGKDAK